MSSEQSPKLPKLTGMLSAARQGFGRLAAPRVEREPRGLVAIGRRASDAVGQIFAGSGGGSLLKGSFLAFVALPTLLFWIYAAFWQSERYATEMRLTVRAPQEQKRSGDAASMMSKMMGGGSAGNSQDAFIVLNYVRGRSIVADVGGHNYMEKKFGRPEIDYFSRLPASANIEESWKYWQAHVSASVDTMAGIVTVRVDAFEPQDALDVATDIIRLSEELVNRITLRNRNDALNRAEGEVTLMRERLAEARRKVLVFRNQNVLIDPGEQAKSVNEMLTRLTLERVDLIKDLSTFSGALAHDAPSQRMQRSRLAIVEQQIAELKKKLADTQGSNTVSAQIATYERLKLDEQFAEKLYAIAQTTYETARHELEKQQLYLLTVIPPGLPESAAFPKVTTNTVLVFCGLLIAWSVISLLTASIKDHME